MIFTKKNEKVAYALAYVIFFVYLCSRKDYDRDKALHRARSVGGPDNP